MLKTYIVYEPEGARAGDAERAEFVPEKFSWLAFLFAPLWLLFNRLWLAFVLYAAALALIASAVYLLRVNNLVGAAALILPSLVVAFEGAQLRRFRLLQKGCRETDVVIADDLESAERRYFERRKLPARSDTPPPSPSLPEAPRAANPVIGLFPERGR